MMSFSRHSPQSLAPLHPGVRGMPLARCRRAVGAGNPWILLAFSVVVAVLSGCASVKPWERHIVAEPAMQLDPNPVVSSSDDHIYFSREASKGGRGFGG